MIRYDLVSFFSWQNHIGCFLYRVKSLLNASKKDAFLNHFVQQLWLYFRFWIMSKSLVLDIHFKINVDVYTLKKASYKYESSSNPGEVTTFFIFHFYSLFKILWRKFCDVTIISVLEFNSSNSERFHRLIWSRNPLDVAIW